MTAPISLRALKLTLKGRIESLSAALGLGDPTLRTADEWRFGRKGSLAIVMRGDKRGMFFDHEAAVGGGPIDLIAHCRGLTFREAVSWAYHWVGSDTPTPQPSTTPFLSLVSGKVDEPKPTQDIAARVWESAVPLVGSLGETYLLHRCGGLPLHDLSHVLRFHPATITGGQSLPALIALMTDPATGQPVGIHRTFLTPQGNKHPIGKRMLGQKGVIRLWPDEAVTLGLHIAEGIETALAGAHLYGFSPIWACADAGGLSGFPILGGIEAITILADHDRSGTGEKSAQLVGERWVNAGKEAACFRTCHWGDFADLIEGKSHAA